MNEQAVQQMDDESLPTAPETLMRRLDDIGVKYTRYDHEAVFTVEESSKLETDMPGTHCRNLFVRDKKKRMFLVVLPNEVAVDMKKLAPVIGSDRLSFGSADRLWQYLGVRPGSVCPFSIINDTDKNVTIVLDKGMMEAEIVNYHPLINTMTLGLSPADLLKFIEDCGHEPKIADLTQASPDL